jgi:small-conductance mechanosensitive channel
MAKDLCLHSCFSGYIAGRADVVTGFSIRSHLFGLAIGWFGYCLKGSGSESCWLAGDVVDLRIFQFTLLEIGNWVDADQSTGRIIHIPNGKVFTEVLANYSKGFQYIWNEIPVLITFESNWEKAKEILQKIGSKHAEHLSESAKKKLRDAARKFLIFYSKLTPTVYTSVKDSGVLLTMRYLCEPRRRRGSEHAIWEDILCEFNKCPDYDFAYPTQRFFNSLREGKGEVKPLSGKRLNSKNETD